MNNNKEPLTNNITAISKLISKSLLKLVGKDKEIERNINTSFDNVGKHIIQ